LNLTFRFLILVCHESAEIRVTGSKMAQQKEKSSRVQTHIGKISGFLVLTAFVNTSGVLQLLVFQRHSI
jgi:hypothetical protein